MKESLSEQKEVFDKEIKKNQKRVQDSNFFLFDFEFLTYEYISWPDMYRGHLTKTNMTTRCLASVKFTGFFTIFVSIPSKQQTKHVMTPSVCKICPNFNIWGYGLRNKRFEGSRLPMANKIILGLQATKRWGSGLHARNKF